MVFDYKNLEAEDGDVESRRRNKEKEIDFGLIQY
jgi:hypothetical protein